MKKDTIKKIIIMGLSMGLVVSLSACGNSGKAEGGNTIKISGSTSVGPLMEKVSEIYSENNGVNIEINQVGSSSGIKDVLGGVAEIGMVSRDLKDEEKESLDETVIAYDGITVIVNTNNNLDNLSVEEVKSIFTGEIKNWSEVSSNLTGEIVVVSREDGSGTRGAFQEIIGYESEELIGNAMIVNSNGALKEAVSGNENSIGFISFEYLDEKVNALNIDNVEPKAELVKSGDYKISRPFLLINRLDDVSEESQKLINFILSEEGQTIVSENGLISIK